MIWIYIAENVYVLIYSTALINFCTQIFYKFHKLFSYESLKSNFDRAIKLSRSIQCHHKRPQAKCSPTCEMSVCGEYVYNMYVKKCHQRDGKFPPLPPLKAPPLIKHSMGLFK